MQLYCLLSNLVHVKENKSIMIPAKFHQTEIDFFMEYLNKKYKKEMEKHY